MNAATAVVEDLRARGIALRVVAGRLEVHPASALTDRDRAAIRRHVADLVTELTPRTPPAPLAGELWDGVAAQQLMFDADTLVGRYGVDGREPAIQAAATRVIEAFAARDPTAFRSDLSEFVATVRRLAAERGPACAEWPQLTRG